MTANFTGSLVSSSVVPVHDMTLTYILLIVIVLISMFGGYLLAVRFMERSDRSKVTNGGLDVDPCQED